MEAACRAGADEGRESGGFTGRVNIYNMYICVAVVIYLVSFVANLPLLSRNPNFTLMQKDGRDGQKEREMKNIRENGNFLHNQLFQQTILITALYIMNIHTQLI